MEPQIVNTPGRDEALYVGLAAIIAAVAHAGVILYENKPVPARKVAGSLIVTAFVSVGASALLIWKGGVSPWSLLLFSVIVGLFGGPAIVALLSHYGRRYVEARANKLIADTSNEEPK